MVQALADLARDGRAAARPVHVQLAARALGAALNDLADILGARFLHASDRSWDAVFTALARDHRVRLRHV